MDKMNKIWESPILKGAGAFIILLIGFGVTHIFMVIDENKEAIGETHDMVAANTELINMLTLEVTRFITATTTEELAEKEKIDRILEDVEKIVIYMKSN